MSNNVKPGSVKAFRQQLQGLADALDNPDHGFFGPGSVTWHLTRENVLLAGGMRALLLQVAHPKVAQGVVDHSAYQTDPFGRAFRTFDAVYNILFGTADTAIDMATRVFAVHQRVKGQMPSDNGTVPAESYRADDPELLLWVHATLIDSTMFGYERLVEPLTWRQRCQFYEESLVFGQLFGVSDDVAPPDLIAFRRYMDRMLDTELQVSDAGRAVANALLNGGPRLTAPLRPVSRVLAAGMLPDRLRRDFGLRWSRTDQAAYRSITRAASRINRRLPMLVRQHPSATSALRRTVQ